MQDDLTCGIDVGSVAVKVVVLSGKRNIVRSYYRRSCGQPAATLHGILTELNEHVQLRTIRAAATTGSGGKHIAELLGCSFINEVVALVLANGVWLPEIRTVIEMGGEDSKLLLFRKANGSVALEDFAMNSLCAAGTGSFLDQQARRLGMSLEEEFGELALRSLNPPRIAGRCSVFAKSDMIHLQQTATPDYDIVAGLCYAVARNFKSVIAKGKRFRPPIAFEGGVAANKGMVRAFTEVLALAPTDLIVPQHHTQMPALGAALSLQGQPRAGFHLDPDNLRRNGKRRLAFDRRLQFAFPESKHYDQTQLVGRRLTRPAVGYLGVDVGSLSTNVVVIDEHGEVLARRYLMTAGRPLEAVKQGLQEVGRELAGQVTIKGCGTTGSGRYLVGDFIGADLIRNEITAQATAAMFIDPEVDTIFEIGGQDSKYISIENGVVVDFEMNKACAAGTGSFLQEQAEKLDIRIEEEFGRRALAAPCPVGCGERCTVFMESDLVSHQHAGAGKDDLVAGLAYSIVKNYLTKVVCGRRIGRRVFFQGGVAWNRGVVAAFEMVLGSRITVPPHHDVTGAIGAALLVRHAMIPRTRFKGFSAAQRPYRLKTFVCEDCSNQCEIRQVEVEGEEALTYGSRCEKYDIRSRPPAAGVTDLFRRRDKLWLASLRKPREHRRNGIRIGLPRTTLMFELLPFWATLFQSLGFKVVLSHPSSAKIVSKGLELAGAESCFPIKITYGHVMDLIERGVDFVFLPSVVEIKERDAPGFGDLVCPYVQSLPYTVGAGIDIPAGGPQLLSVPVHLRYDEQLLADELSPLRAKLRLSRRELRRAIREGLAAQRAFVAALQAEGERVMTGLAPDRPALVVVSRPYNGCDAKLSLEIPRRIAELGVQAIPLDFLPAVGCRDERYLDNMYWRYGERILGACRTITATPNLYAIYITNFGCGPDSFITHFFKEKMQGKPYLQIEVDEHSADAGVITRIEAFLDSIAGRNSARFDRDAAAPGSDRGRQRPAGRQGNDGTPPRKIFVPAMCDHAHAFAAAFRACGVDAEVLPESTDEAADLGRELTSGKECFPCLLTAGDMVAKIQSPGFDRDRSAFFMPSASGPCRFGQYSRFQRMLLDRLGHQDIPLYSPDARNSYNDFGFLDSGRLFRKLGWMGLAATDVLTRLRCRINPYETEPGATEVAYRQSLAILADAIQRREDVRSAVGRCADLFAAVPVNTSRPKPLIGVVGEIYLRQNRYANGDLVATLEQLGAEVVMAPMSEWVLYTNYTFKRRLQRERRIIDLGRTTLIDIFQNRIEHQLMEEASRRIPLEPEQPMDRVIDLARPYLDPSFVGEAILSIGKAIEYYQRGAQGIVNAMPLTCMPGTIVTAISRKVRRDCHDLPWLNMAYEGLQGGHDLTRLEAFLYQAARFHPCRQRPLPRGASTCQKKAQASA